MQSTLEKKNSEFKPALLHLKMTLCHLLLVAQVLSKYIHSLLHDFTGHHIICLLLGLNFLNEALVYLISF